jgi:hypothetical protein
MARISPAGARFGSSGVLSRRVSCENSIVSTAEASPIPNAKGGTQESTVGCVERETLDPDVCMRRDPRGQGDRHALVPGGVAALADAASRADHIPAVGPDADELPEPSGGGGARPEPAPGRRQKIRTSRCNGETLVFTNRVWTAP